jgi:hypothetical protein
MDMGRSDLLCALLLMGCGDGGDGDDGGDTEGCAEADQLTVFTDADGDGYGAGQSIAVCEAGQYQVEVGGDCDDGAPQVHPGAPEICNGGIDDDCDGPADDDDEATDRSDFYEDDDGDGYGAGAAVQACEISVGLADNELDCDDTDDAVHPDAVEICDGVDNDCDTGTSESGTVGIGSGTYASIQEAITAASDGDVVHICGGTFDENLSITKDVELEGVGASLTIIDGNDAGPVVAVDTQDVHLTIRGLTLRNGVATMVSDIGVEAGGGIEAWNAASLEVEDCVIEHNEAELGGGIFGPESGNTSLRDTTVTHNAARADSGGGAFLQSAAHGTIDIDGCEFSDNYAWISGGGIAFDNFTATIAAASITDTLIDGNWTMYGGFGGGIASVAELSLSNVTISNNEADLGGGVYALGDVEADSATDIIDNHADAATHSPLGRAVGGGGIFVDSCDWQYGHLEGNTASQGAGAFVYEGSLRDVTVESNEATGFGGGVAMYNHARLEDSDVIANTAGIYGGGLFVYGSDVNALATVDSCSITDNVAKFGGGGAYIELQEFESIDTDWGTGATDNSDDLLFRSGESDYVTYYDFGTSEDFVCDYTSDDCG